MLSTRCAYLPFALSARISSFSISDMSIQFSPMRLSLLRATSAAYWGSLIPFAIVRAAWSGVLRAPPPPLDGAAM